MREEGRGRRRGRVNTLAIFLFSETSGSWSSGFGLLTLTTKVRLTWEVFPLV